MSPDVLIIGAGPAGLALSSSLGAYGVSYRILERGQGVGQSWRDHYRRLHLHTTRDLSALPGLAFGEDVPTFPSRAQFVRYLEDYACQQRIPVELGVSVRRLTRKKPGWVASCPGGEILAPRVVLATGLQREPHRPSFQGEERFAGEIVHSADYRDASPFEGKRVLVVGAGNTGAEIALDLVEQGCRVLLCVRSPLHVVPRSFLGRPTQVSGLATRHFPLWFRDRLGGLVSRLRYPDLADLGLIRPRMGVYSHIEKEGKIPLIDIGTIQHIRRGNIRVRPGVRCFDERRVHFQNGSVDEVDAVVLATGYRSGLSRWVDGAAAIVDERGAPTPAWGATALPGLYTLGYSIVAGGLLRHIALTAPRLARQIAQATAGHRP